MTNGDNVRFYAAIRGDAETLARLGAATSEAELIELIMDEAQSRGFELTADLVRAGLSDLAGLMREAANGEELTELELEIVSGGTMFSSFVEHRTTKTLSCK
ncbi:hypothetical protein IB267_18090 [Ensifer sp. ENS09]|nr:Nif11-like leader peptide family natural product precursor [Ensifer sp. ENS09]MBD9650260.1 hypothetical protein [Ensifer sp. ENS09]